MNAVFERLLANGPVITDGAWATRLQQLGLPLGACPDAWNITNPELVAQVAAEYVSAGSQIILTNTFGANRVSLGKHGLDQSAERLNREGAAISKLAAKGAALVFGSVGPSGEVNATGMPDVDKLHEVFLEQAYWLADAGVDGLVLETMYSTEEALIAMRAAKSANLPVVASMTFVHGEDADRTITGGRVEQAALALIEAGADAIGANCGYGARQMLSICKRIKAVSSIPVWMKPNSGLPDLMEGRAAYNVGAQEFVRDVMALVAAGADFVGGCCGTGPDHIRAIARPRPLIVP